MTIYNIKAVLTYSFSYLEPVCWSMSNSNCCFLTCIQISLEAGQVVWYPHLFQNFPLTYINISDHKTSSWHSHVFTLCVFIYIFVTLSDQIFNNLINILAALIHLRGCNINDSFHPSSFTMYVWNETRIVKLSYLMKQIFTHPFSKHFLSSPHFS